MIVTSHIYKNSDWDSAFNSSLDSQNTLILFFSSVPEPQVKVQIAHIKQCFPTSILLGASTSGEIFDDEVYDDTIVVTIIQFQSTSLKTYHIDHINSENSFESGVAIAEHFELEKLQGLFVLSDGLNTNGSQITRGIGSIIGSNVVVSGGLAGDKDRFEKTWILHGDELKDAAVQAIGFYGDHIYFEAASKGGWDSLGLKRVVTKSKNNVLYELDNKPALDIYKRYLGDDKAKELPSSGLLFPLELKSKNANDTKVRTVLTVNEEEKSITFAGDIPEHATVTFMKANFERLIDGAEESAESLNFTNYHGEPLVCIAISCVGRKLVLKSRIDEEVESVKEVLPDNASIVGFYSYGEISPLVNGTCDLHNQTMTLTSIWESNA
ncbi:MAG TPA: hypothetical protein ENK73_05550 [Thiomicrospira sp.]|nr:hypothetical protein [Thiomicrospira sp.]